MAASYRDACAAQVKIEVVVVVEGERVVGIVVAVEKVAAKWVFVYCIADIHSWAAAAKQEDMDAELGE
ncbi:hypothetical protein G6F42_020655 [Rhizopus arrhizus]|nr:hypothetical protein G6F42_020655 [Rhizopus arrhizus]